MKKWQIVVLVIAVAVLAAGIGAYAATNYGTQSDPLVAMSYLEKVLGPKMEQQLDEQIAEAAEQYKSQYGAEAGGFSVVQLPSGETLSVGEGCEIVLRSGACAASGALVDVTSGSELASGGALTANHLYVGSGSGVTASANSTLLVRGAYSVS